MIRGNYVAVRSANERSTAFLSIAASLSQAQKRSFAERTATYRGLCLLLSAGGGSGVRATQLERILNKA